MKLPAILFDVIYKRSIIVMILLKKDPVWYAVFLDGTQYAKGRYAVRKNPVIYRTQTFIFTLKKVQFSSRNTKNAAYKVK